MTNKTPKWAAAGDVNAFFGLMLDNVADLLLTVGLLSAIFGFPVKFALRHMVPGTAIGVLVGDLLFFWMALRMARRTGRNDITAMPLGLDTPSTFGMVFFVLGPAFLAARESMDVEQAAVYTWQIGICAIFISGLFKFACALGSGWIRKVVPRAGLLGSLAAIAMVLISFLPFLEVLQYPLVGFVSLSIILTTLVARIRLPGRVPGALGALIVASLIYYLLHWTGNDALLGPRHVAEIANPNEALFPTEWLAVFRFDWVSRLQDSLQYMPIVIPFALGTVIGGIDCTESAAAAGDEFDTRSVIAVEALATTVAGLCGGVIQTTPYIGHPAYKAMGGRSAYTLATALFIGSAGLLGYFGYLYLFIPKATVFPILIFIGLEITAQSFHATPKRHYPAVVIACIPALASLGIIFIDKLLGEIGPDAVAALSQPLTTEIQTVRMLANGFIVTSLLWAAGLAALIDRRMLRAAVYFTIAGVCCLFGIIHSPLPGAPAFLPWNLPEDMRILVIRFALGYFAMAILLGIWSQFVDLQPVSEEGDDHVAQAHA